MDNPKPLVVFKLKHNIIMDSEVDLAKREIQSLTGANSLTKMENLADLFIGNTYPQITPFLKHRIQDKITRVPYLGSPQGYILHIQPNKPIDIRKLQRRLAYCKEIYVFCLKKNLNKILTPKETKTLETKPTSQEIPLDDLSICLLEPPWAMIRLFTHSFLMELIHYMPILGSRRATLNDNIKIMEQLKTKLLKHLHESKFVQPYGGFLRDIEDYADLYINYKTYLTHSIHKFKGRAFHRMTRALLNITAPHDDDVVLDPFSGSGTTLLEAQILGLKSIGIDIVEFFNKIARAKTKLITLETNDFKEILRCLNLCKKAEASQILDRYVYPEEMEKFDKILKELNSRVNQKVKNTAGIDIKDLAWIYSVIKRLPKDKQEIVEVLLSQVLETTPKNREIDKSKLIEKIQLALINTYLELHTARSLSLIPKKPPLPRIISTDATTECTPRLKEELQTMGRKGIDAIVTSPPYVNALDYLEMHKTSMSLIEGIDEFSPINEKIIGYPSFRKGQKIEKSKLPPGCRKILEDVARKSSYDNKYTIGLYNYMRDLQNNLEKMHNIMNKGAKAAYIVGKEGYWRANGRLITVKAAKFIRELIEQRFKILETIDIDLLKRKPYAKAAVDETIERPLDKTTLATETVIIFTKK
jgi:DNA modification methylase